MTSRILCPTDGSENAEKAVSIASDLAKKYDAELVLLHVQLANASGEELRHFAEIEGLAPDTRSELSRLPSVQSQNLMAGGAPLSEPISAEVLDRVAEYALQSAEKIASAKGVSKISTLVDRGDAGKRILDCAKEEHAEMVVMGSRGLGNLQSLLLGSVSQYVSSRVACTCVTVH